MSCSVKEDFNASAKSLYPDQSLQSAETDLSQTVFAFGKCSVCPRTVVL